MRFYLPNFKSFSKEHTGVFIAGILIVIVLASALFIFIYKKPQYIELKDALNNGDFTLVINKGEAFLTKNSDDLTLTHLLAGAYMSEGIVSNNRQMWVGKAITLLTKSIAKHESAESERLLGYAYFLLSDYTSARAYYEKSANLDGGKSLVWANLGQLFESQGNFSKADANYTKAISIDPDNSLANLGKIRGMMRLGKYSEAQISC